MKNKALFIVCFCYYLCISPLNGQESYPARVVSGPNIALDLFRLQGPDIMKKVPHLHSLDIKFGLGYWTWTCNPSVATSTMSLKFEQDPIIYVGFTMELPNGGYKKVTFEEAGITPQGVPSICDMKLDIEFGSVGAWATAELDTNRDGKGHASLHFTKKTEALDEFLKFDHEKKKYKTVQEIFSGLDPQVTISYMGTYNCTVSTFEDNFFLDHIRRYIEREYAEASLRIEFDNLMADAQNAETFGDIDRAIEKYEAAYKVKRDPAVKAKIDELKAKKEEQGKQDEVDKLLNQAQQAEQSGNKDEAYKLYQKANSIRPSSQIEKELARLEKKPGDGLQNKTSSAQNTTQLDYWGNPVEASTGTVNYGGMEVQNNSTYRQQMDLRERNAAPRESWEQEQAAKRQAVDDHNDAVINDFYQTNTRLQNEMDDMNNAFAQLGTVAGSGDITNPKTLITAGMGILKSAKTMKGVRMGAAVGGVGIGLGIISQFAGDSKAEREAEEKRREEEKKLKAAKEALHKARVGIFKSYPEGELPVSSTKSSGNNLYYFAYGYNTATLEEDEPEVLLTNSFAIGRYPDGTWPMVNKVKTQITATLVPYDAIICGPFYSKQEAESVLISFSGYLQQTNFLIIGKLSGSYIKQKPLIIVYQLNKSLLQWTCPDNFRTPSLKI